MLNTTAYQRFQSVDMELSTSYPIRLNISLFHLSINASQSTGVSVDDEVASSFQKFKLQQEPYKLRYFIYEIKDKKTIIISKQGERSKTYDDFVEEMPENECRYGLIDIEFETDDGRPTSKLVFISWNPDTASVRPKMIYSGSKEALKSALVGVGIHINATDHSELDFETAILPVVKKFAWERKRRGRDTFMQGGVCLERVRGYAVHSWQEMLMMITFGADVVFV